MMTVTDEMFNDPQHPDWEAYFEKGLEEERRIDGHELDRELALDYARDYLEDYRDWRANETPLSSLSEMTRSLAHAIDIMDALAEAGEAAVLSLEDALELVKEADDE